MITSKNFFIIAGLPRSGTAWLAAALNLHPRILAFHDGFVDVRKYTDKIEHALGHYQVVVDVTSNMLPEYDSVPATRLFIERNPNVCTDSARRISEKFGAGMPEAVEISQAWREKHRPHVFKFDELMGPEYYLIISYLMTIFDLPNRIDREKLSQLALMNIQLHGLSDSYYDDKKIQLHP